MEKYLDSNGVLRLLQGVKTQLEKYKQSVLDTKGQAKGIASLDSKGFVPLSQLGNLDTTLFEIVSELPTLGIMKHIYLVRNDSHTGGNDLYTEYIYTGDVEEDYDKDNWEELGSFAPDFDLADYVHKGDSIKSGSISIKATDDNTNALVFTYTTVKNPNKELTVEIPVVTKDTNGLMTSDDKVKLDKIDLNALEAAINNANTAADNTNTAIKNAEKATAEAEAVNAELTDDNVFKVTDRHSNVKTLQLYDQASINTELAGIKGKTDKEEGVDTSKVNLRTLSEGLEATSAGVKGIIGNTDDAEDNIDTKDVNLKSLSKDIASIKEDIGNSETEGSVKKAIADNKASIATINDNIKAISGGDDAVETDKVNLRTLSKDVSALKTAIGDDTTEGSVKKDIADINTALDTKVSKDTVKTEVNDSDDEIPTSKAVKAGLDEVKESVIKLEDTIGSSDKEGTVKGDIKKLQDSVSSLPKFLSMTESEYSGLDTVDADTYYMITEE